MKTIPVKPADKTILARSKTHKALPVRMELPWAVPVKAAHALLMTIGSMPLLFVGFLFTAGPKWLGLREVSARSLLTGLTLMPVGWVIALIGFHIHTPLAGSGVAGVATGWTVLSLKFLSMPSISKVPDRVLARAVAVTCGVDPAGRLGDLARGQHTVNAFISRGMDRDPVGLGHSIRTMVRSAPPGWMPRLNPT